MDLYRRSNVFERVLSLYNSPGLPEFLRRKMLHLIFRACEAGGSTTLLTRSGAFSWIQGQVAEGNNYERILRDLTREMYNTCDREWVDGWSGSSLSQKVDKISV